MAIAVDPDTAFQVFTEEIGLWWGSSPDSRFRHDIHGTMRFVPCGPGGRLLEVYEGTDEPPHEIGRVLAWEPGKRLVFDWRALAFRPGEITEVEVTFAPTEDGTRVTLEHKGWDVFPQTHPVKHGMPNPDFNALIGTVWARRLTGMRVHAEKRTDRRA
jgi:uncharacterized protein YndB with AHSA1/START domain